MNGKAARSLSSAVVAGGLGALFARTLSVVGPLVAVPALIGHLGAAGYGRLVFASTAVSFLGLTYGWLAQGLISHVARLVERGDGELASAIVRSAIGASARIALGAAGGWLLLRLAIPWGALVGVLGPEESALPMLDALVACALLRVPTVLVDALLRGMHLVHWASFAGALAGCLAAIGAVWARWTGAGVATTVLLWMALPALACVPAWLIVQARAPWLVWERSPRAKEATRALYSASRPLLWLQVSGAVGCSSDTLVVGAVLDSEAVSLYAVTSKIFTIPMQVCNLALAPLWPAYAAALGQGRIDWVRRTFRATAWACVALGAAIGLGLCQAAPTLLEVWTGHRLVPPLALTAALGCWLLLGFVATALSLLLSGAQALDRVGRFSLLTMVANLGLSVALAKAVGISGVMWSSVLTQSLFLVLPAVVEVRRVLHSAGCPVVRVAESAP